MAFIHTHIHTYIILHMFGEQGNTKMDEKLELDCIVIMQEVVFFLFIPFWFIFFFYFTLLLGYVMISYFDAMYNYFVY